LGYGGATFGHTPIAEAVLAYVTLSEGEKWRFPLWQVTGHSHSRMK